MSIKYQDTMDSARVVEPIEVKGSQTLCHIWWRDANRGVLDYGGKAWIASSLFDESNKRNDFIGFKLLKDAA